MAGVKVSGEIVQGAGVQIADDGTISATVSSLSFDALFGSTPGAFVYRGSASWTALSPGAVGQLLQSGGANGTPSWLSPSGVLDSAFGATQGDVLQRGASSWSAVTPSAMLDSAFGTTQGDVLQRGASAWSAVTPSAMLDSAFGTTQGDILYRGASGWVALSHGTAGQVLQSGGVSANPAWATLSNAVYRSYLAGLTLSTAGSSSTFSVAGGSCADSTNAVLITLAALSKTTAAWSAGNNGGALDTGTIAANTWYHVFAIAHSDGSSPDILISLSATAPTLPSGYALFRRIGSLKTDGSSNWTAFTQLGDKFIWSAAVADVNNVTPSTASRTLYALSVPSGVVVTALYRGYLGNSSGSGVNFVFTSPLELDGAATTGGAGISLYATPTNGAAAGHFATVTDTSARVGARANGTCSFFIWTYGWLDRRGKDT